MRHLFGLAEVAAAAGKLARFLTAEEYREARLDLLLPVLAVLGFLVAWCAAVALFRLPGYLLPSPVDVASEMAARRHILLAHGLDALWAVMARFLLSIAIAGPLAAIIVSSRTLERMLTVTYYQRSG